MKKILGLLVVGILLWYAAERYQANRQLNKPGALEIPSELLPDEPVAVTVPEARSTPQPVPEDAADRLVLTGSVTTPVPTSPINQDGHHTPENLVLSISEDLAIDMERDWDDLPNQIHVMEEEGGWRVLYIREGSLFSQTGLRVGDLINRQLLESLDAGVRAGDPLSQRMSRIFAHTSVQ
jgi:hypothetical protein